MATASRHLYTERCSAARTMARFYALSIEPTLFGDVCLTRLWGRIGTRGRMKAMSFAREEEALTRFARLQRQKANRGYRECRSVRASKSQLVGKSAIRMGDAPMGGHHSGP